MHLNHHQQMALQKQLTVKLSYLLRCASNIQIYIYEHRDTYILHTQHAHTLQICQKYIEHIHGSSASTGRGSGAAIVFLWQAGWHKSRPPSLGKNEREGGFATLPCCQAMAPVPSPIPPSGGKEGGHEPPSAISKKKERE